MDLSAACEERHRKIDRIWYCIFGNGEKGLVQEMEGVKVWQKEIEALVNQVKGLKILIVLASVISAVQIIMKFVRP